MKEVCFVKRFYFRCESSGYRSNARLLIFFYESQSSFPDFTPPTLGVPSIVFFVNEFEFDRLLYFHRCQKISLIIRHKHKNMLKYYIRYQTF